MKGSEKLKQTQLMNESKHGRFNIDWIERYKASETQVITRYRSSARWTPGTV